MCDSRAFLHVFLLLCLSSACGSLESRGQEEAPAPRFVAEEEVGAWVSMWNTYDLSKVDELFLQDARVSYFSSEREGLIKGIEAVREHHVGFGFVDGGKTPENELWMEDLDANTFGTVAVVTGVWFFGKRGDPEVQRGPVTFVYVWEGGAYRLAHLHFANY